MDKIIEGEKEVYLFLFDSVGDEIDICRHAHDVRIRGNVWMIVQIGIQR